MSQRPPLTTRLFSLIEPGFLLFGSAKSFIKQAFRVFILRGTFPTPSAFVRVRDEAFSMWWTKITAPIDPPPPPVGSSTLVAPILSRAHGVVLDIGPGSGSHVSAFSDNPNITTIYGAEPAVGLHPALQERIDAAGLTDTYHVLACMADKKDLIAALAEKEVAAADDDIAGGVFDTIVAVRVLCSVPDLDGAARELYSLLRPGGELMVVEHVRNPWTVNGSILGRLAQILYTFLGWRFFLAGCNMNRDTASSLRKAGKWEAVDLKMNFEWAALPYISGTLTKAR
ncbi:uncharacterized protein PV06_06789 [Exophiala oligosperma]|uniref:Methyltransferase type 11 domain-containing protein n=3 Tax=Chaetothyriales TaxID=34395 RepID=A0A0D2DDS2_9EURO|nr:uncharacterized protein PV06_06789 [Exophiala oligosperma]KAJ9633415.1 hypothetical protein H2204_006965 [Knufia peltigerae]KIW41213.1 hypothetical protein PV06_06789 [Exophiala oligosperma]